MNRLLADDGKCSSDDAYMKGLPDAREVGLHVATLAYSMHVSNPYI